MSTESKDAADKAVKKGGPNTVFSVGLDADAHRQVMAQAKKLNVTKSKYASAAIAYFAESGLDPTKEQRLGFAGVAEKVAVVEQNVRTQNHEIGTRLIQIIRAWEKNLYTFMQQQQASTNNYLELIESNILQHQVTVESNTLAPMVEALFKSNIEAFITRSFASHLYLTSTSQPAENFPKQMERSNEERDIQLTTQMREHLKTNSVPLPKPTPRRAVTPVPAAPPKTVAAASPAPAAGPKS